MPVPDLSIYKVADTEVSSATKFNNLVQAIQNELGVIDPDQIPGYPSSVAAFLRGDGAWAGAFAAYTPTWTATTAPAIGNGTLAGRFLQVGKAIIGSVDLTAGSTTTFGTGSWDIGLPVAALTPFLRGIGTVTLIDASPFAVHAGFVRLNTASSVQLDTVASPTSQFAATIPITFASGDTVRFTFAYEAA